MPPSRSSVPPSRSGAIPVGAVGLGMEVQVFTVNPFQENTYVLWDSSGEAILLDPGMVHPSETDEVAAFLQRKGFQLRQVVLTHAHLDHVFGCQWAFDRYGLAPRMHPDSRAQYQAVPQQALMFGMPPVELPVPGELLDAAVPLRFGATELELRLTPGHAPGHLVLVHHPTRQVVAGDVLFRGSIGRTDLPGGSYEVLLRSLHTEVLSLPDDYTVHSGHGPSTTIGHERRTNPFLQ